MAAPARRMTPKVTHPARLESAAKVKTPATAPEPDPKRVIPTKANEATHSYIVDYYIWSHIGDI